MFLRSKTCISAGGLLAHGFMHYTVAASKKFVYRTNVLAMCTQRRTHILNIFHAESDIFRHIIRSVTGFQCTRTISFG